MSKYRFTEEIYRKHNNVNDHMHRCKTVTQRTNAVVYKLKHHNFNVF